MRQECPEFFKPFSPGDLEKNGSHRQDIYQGDQPPSKRRRRRPRANSHTHFYIAVPFQKTVCSAVTTGFYCEKAQDLVDRSVAGLARKIDCVIGKNTDVEKGECPVTHFHMFLGYLYVVETLGVVFCPSWRKDFNFHFGFPTPGGLFLLSEGAMNKRSIVRPSQTAALVCPC